MENEELIRQKMERTRESITEKLNALEDRVTDSVQQATHAVTETAATVKDAVDIKAQVDRHPWVMFGGAVVAGMVAERLLFSRERREPPSRAEEPLGSIEQPRSMPSPAVEQVPRPPRKPSLFAAFEPEILRFKELAIGVTLGIVREALVAEMPPPLAAYTGEIVNGVTQKLGGVPLTSSELPFVEKQQPSPGCATPGL